MPNTPTADLVLTAEAATIIGVDVRTVHRWVDSGRLQPAVTAPVGTRPTYVFHRRDVLQARDDRRAKYLGTADVA